MRKYLLAFSTLYLVLLTIIFFLLILSCNIKTEHSSQEKKIDNKRPYDFKMKIRVQPLNGNIQTSGSDRDLTQYKEKDGENDDDDLFFKIKEKNNEIFVSFIYDEDSKTYIHLFKVKSERLSEFKNAMINGGSFKCFLNKTSDSNKEEYKNEEEFRVVKGTDKSKGYVFLDFKDIKYSFAVSENETKLL